MKTIKELLLVAQNHELKYGRKPARILVDSENWEELRKDVYKLNDLKYNAAEADRMHKDMMLLGGFEVYLDSSTTIDFSCEG